MLADMANIIQILFFKSIMFIYIIYNIITETMIDENIKKRNITTIIVAHRLSTIRDADKIIVLDGGEIAEAGSHEELMKQNGVYRSLIDSGEAD